MQKKYFSAALFFLISSLSLCQTENYLIKKASFSSEKYDEFSPVYYRKGIVYCSNRGIGIISGYSTMADKRYFNIYYIDTAGNPRWREGRALQGEINSLLNNGPATFSPGGDTVYFSRNLIVKGSYKKIPGRGNKLGLFSAVLKNGKWVDVKGLRFNDNSYNITTPFLSPDGKKLYFASDRPEGYGGSDIYFSQWKNGYWDNPVNLGPVINTRGNEAYPFINDSGELFFSSDSLPGRGGKDIFFSKYVDTAWIKPVGLKAPVNSDKDDFGFIADNITGRGFFSSNRGTNLDIYSFRTVYPQFFYCTLQKNDRYCFSFIDDSGIDIDPISLLYRWEFSDGSKTTGYIADHCFKGPGNYSVKEDVIERKGERVVFNKLFLEFELKNPDMPYIKSDNTALTGEPVSFSARISLTDHEMLSCYWEFGDSNHAKGESVVYTFKEKGDVPVRMLVNIKDRKTGKSKQICSEKRISVKGRGDKSEDTNNSRNGTPFAVEGNIDAKKRYSAKDAIEKKAVFQVQIMSSKKNIPPDDPLFDNLRPEYSLRTFLRKEDNLYSYVIDEQLQFMAAYPAFRDALSRGFSGTKIITRIPHEADEIELWNFKRNSGSSSGVFFINKSFSLSADASTVLEQLVLILKRNPGMKILIAAHTENSGLPTDDLMLSRRQAEKIKEYLTGRGIDKSRLSSAGYGSARPVAPDYPESERRKNNRIDFIKVN